MASSFKQILKLLLSLSPIAFSKNAQYDKLTKKIIKQVCKPDSVCIDIGCHEGSILEMMIDAAPNAKHYAFEPIEELYRTLKVKFHTHAKIHCLALSNKRSIENFNLVLTDMAYSGLLKRAYDGKEKDASIFVNTDLLDNIIQPDKKITLIKIDVEGAELWVLQGAIKTIQSSQPLILFEFGKAGASAYDYDDNTIFQFIIESLNYTIFTLENWLSKSGNISATQFSDFYQTGSEYFFVAAPSKYTA